jgi:hypothetical protein
MKERTTKTHFKKAKSKKQDGFYCKGEIRAKNRKKIVKVLCLREFGQFRSIKDCFASLICLLRSLAKP